MYYKTRNLVRMHDTDMAGILYFPRIYRFVNDGLEDLMESEGYGFIRVFKDSKLLTVTVHCEADYYSPLKVGDELNIHIAVERIGSSSFTMVYEIYKTDQTHAGRAKTVFTVIDRETKQKAGIPDPFKSMLEKYLLQEPA
ncbi:MAG: acyl-CoA thioesterase [Parachlamydia sp.]|nr:acyl-CoA thioesterase [Parachlamydia sp.]